MLREMRVDFERSPSVCVCWRREEGDRDGAETELGQRPLCVHPSWWLLCGSEVSWCCVITSIMPVASHSTHYLSPRCTRSHVHTCTCTNWMFWQTQSKKTKGAWIKAAARDCYILYILCTVPYTVSFAQLLQALWSFWPCTYFQPPSCWMSWTGRRL